MSEPAASGAAYCWDHEASPRDNCGGETQQQDRFNVLCLACEGVWTHVKTATEHILPAAEFETIATKPITPVDHGAVTNQSAPGAESPASPEVNHDGE